MLYSWEQEERGDFLESECKLAEQDSIRWAHRTGVHLLKGRGTRGAGLERRGCLWWDVGLTEAWPGF